MSDNPSFEELEIIVDENGFAEAATGFTNISQAAEGATESLSGLNDVAAQTGELITSSVQSAQEQWGGFNQTLDETLQKFNQISAATPDMSGGGDGGGGVDLGNPLAIGRGARALGGLIPGIRPEATGAADILFISRGVQELQGVFESLNSVIEQSPGILGPVVEGFTALGVPMAGLLAVIGPVAAAVIALGLAISSFVNTIQEGQKAIDAAEKEKIDIYKTEESGTTDSINKKIAAAKAESSANQQAAQDNIDLINRVIEAHAPGATPDQIKDAEAKAARGEGLTALDAGGRLDLTALPGLNDLIGHVKTFDDAANLSAQKVADLTVALKSSMVAANDSAQATIDSSKAHEAQTKQFEADDKLSVKNGQDRVELLKNENDTLTDSNNHIKADMYLPGMTADGYAKLNAQLEANNKTIANNAEELKYLNDTSIPAAEAAKAQGEANKEAKKAWDELEKAIDTFNKTSEATAAELVNRTADAKTKEANAEEQYTQGSLQDTEQRSKIALDESRKEVDLKQQTYDKIVDLGNKLSEQEAKLGEDYGRQQIDDQTKYDESRTKLITDNQISERDATTAHLQKLQDLQTQAHNSDASALLNRNFLQLATTQLGHEQAIVSENTSYDRRMDALHQHLSDQEQAQNVSEQNLRQQQLIAYQRKFEDMQEVEKQQELAANEAEIRKEEQDKIAEQRQLQDLTTSENEKIALLRQGLSNELVILQTAANQKIEIAARTEQTIIAQAEQALAGIVQNGNIGAVIGQAVASPLGQSIIGDLGKGIQSLTGLKLFGQGGSFGANDPFGMGENGPETLNIGGKGYSIPGAAMVYPLQSGSVTPGASGGGGSTIHFAPNINIYGANDPEAAWHQLEPKLNNYVGQMLGL